jgi:hypothetical protein
LGVSMVLVTTPSSPEGSWVPQWLQKRESSDTSA